MPSLTDFDLRFPLGMESGVDPEELPRGSYVRAMNTMHRGRVIQCRPGYYTLKNLPKGNMQGGFRFKPSTGSEQIVFAIDGKVYYSPYPFDEFKQIPGLQFLSTSPFVFFEQAQQAVTRNEDGSLTLITPRAVLMIQDGKTSCGFWDGSIGGHIKGTGKTPLGTLMKWSGERLWVIRGRKIFAGDYADPFSFFEGQYIGDTGAFILPGDPTAIAETPSVQNPSLLVFTNESTVRFLSNIRQRDLWNSVEEFQKTIFPRTGCVGHRAVAAHNGKLWWYSQYGITNMDVAAHINVSSELPYLDTPMVYSKRRLAQDLSGVALGAFENVLLVSVPYCDFENTHTWIYDSHLDELTGRPLGWSSVWTGTRPVEWLFGSFLGRDRIMFLSRDADGINRLWEAFRPERRDNGCPITWGFISRAFRPESPTAFNEFRYAELWLSELEGDVDVHVGWAGTYKGRYKEVLNKRISAMRGSLVFDQDLVHNKKTAFAFRKQTRRIKTVDRRPGKADELSACGVESEREDWVDTGFQICFLANGAGAVRAIRMFFDPFTEPLDGKCEDNETDEVRASRYDGAGAHGEDEEDVIEDLEPELDEFSSTMTKVVTFDSTSAVSTVTSTSSISQLTADKLAECIATMKASRQVEEKAPRLQGGFLVC